MYKIKLFSAIMLTLLFAAPWAFADADFEDIFKAGWNTTPREIMALYDHDTSDFNPGQDVTEAEFHQPMQFNGRNGEAVYTFAREGENEDFSLVVITYTFVFDNNFTGNVYQAVFTELVSYIENNHPSFKFKYITKDVKSKNRWSAMGLGINETNYITVTAGYVQESGSGYVDFARQRNNDPVHEKFYDDFVEQHKNRTNIVID